MATEDSRFSSNGGGGGRAEDFRIGSLISLTSKFDIRYEGVLVNIDNDGASIRLRDVRSFGTEGRRKDGPQVPATDNVYDYLVFRRSEIKDLLVKSAPTVQTAPSVQNDPAIIQSHYTPPAASSSFAAAPSTATQIHGSVPNSGTQIPQAGIPRTTNQNNTPMYHPEGNLPPWNQSPSLATNSSGLPGPMYWSGYYGAPAYNQPQQQPLIGPAQGLPMQPPFQSPLAQQPVLYPNMNSSFLTGASTISAPQSMGFPPPPVQPIINTPIYHPEGNLPLGNPSPSPATNSSGLPGLMYWQGYYGASAYNQPQQQPLIGPCVQNDPAIIQSHYTPPAAPSSFPTAPSTATQIGGSVPDSGTQMPQAGIPQTTHQNIIPMYPLEGNLPPWKPSPSPATNSSGLARPMYWPGYYGAPVYNQPQQQPLTRPAQGLPMQSSFQSPLAQQPNLYPNMNPSFPTGESNISAPKSMGFPPPPVQPIINTSVGPSSTLDSSNMMPLKALPQELPVLPQSANPPSVSSTFSNMLNRSSIPALVPNQAKPVYSSPMPFDSFPEPLSSVGRTSSAPALVTPCQFLQPEPPVSQTSQIAQKDVEVVQVPPFGSRPQPLARVPMTAAPVQVSAETQAPLLPLPSPVKSKMKGVSSHSPDVNRSGRERGRGTEMKGVSSHSPDLNRGGRERRRGTEMKGVSPHTPDVNRCGRDRGRGNEMKGVSSHIPDVNRGGRDRGRENEMNAVSSHTQDVKRGGRDRGRGTEMKGVSSHIPDVNRGGRDRGRGNEMNAVSSHTQDVKRGGRNRGRGTEVNAVSSHTPSVNRCGYDRGRGNESHYTPAATSSSFPAAPSTATQIRGSVPDSDVGKVLEEKEDVHSAEKENKLPPKIVLYDHQHEGIEWLKSLHSQRKGGILADDMGLGKTMQISVFLADLFESGLIKRAMIVAPKILMTQWNEELDQSQYQRIE